MTVGHVLPILIRAIRESRRQAQIFGVDREAMESLSMETSRRFLSGEQGKLRLAAALLTPEGRAIWREQAAATGRQKVFHIAEEGQEMENAGLALWPEGMGRHSERAMAILTHSLGDDTAGGVVPCFRRLLFLRDGGKADVSGTVVLPWAGFQFSWAGPACGPTSMPDANLPDGDPVQTLDDRGQGDPECPGDVIPIEDMFALQRCLVDCTDECAEAPLPAPGSIDQPRPGFPGLSWADGGSGAEVVGPDQRELRAPQALGQGVLPTIRSGAPAVSPEEAGLDAPGAGTRGLVLLEDLDPSAWFEQAVDFLADYARSLPRTDPAGLRENYLEFRAGLFTWLQVGLSEADLHHLKTIYPEPGRVTGALTEFWYAMSQSHRAMRLLAPLFARVLAIPASEAHCERIFSAMRRVLTPLSFRMDENTLFGRLTQSTEGSGGRDSR